MERATQAQDDWTLLRVAIPDRPGGLALLTRCLAACGVDILATEILAHHAGAAHADVLVRGGDLDRALRALDEDVTLRGRRNHGDLPDPGLAMARACSTVAVAPSLDALLEAGLILVGATTGACYPVAADGLGTGIERTGGLRELAQAAVEQQAAVTSDTPAGSAVALLIHEPAPLVVALARDHVFPFEDAELDRLQALAAFAARLEPPLLADPNR